MQFEFLSLLNSSFFQCHESARVGFRSFVCTHFVTRDIKFLHSTINSTTRIIHENSKMYFSWGHFCVFVPLQNDYATFFFYYSEEILVIYSATTLYHFIWLPTHRKWSMHANWSNICLFSLVFQLFYTFKMTWLPVGFTLKQVIFLEDRKPLVDNNEHCLLFNAVSY